MNSVCLLHAFSYSLNRPSNPHATWTVFAYCTPSLTASTGPQTHTLHAQCVCLLHAFSSDSSEQSGLSSHIQVSGTHSPGKARHVNSSGLHTFSSASNTTTWYNLTYTGCNSSRPNSRGSLSVCRTPMPAVYTRPQNTGTPPPCTAWPLWSSKNKATINTVMNLWLLQKPEMFWPGKCISTVQGTPCTFRRRPNELHYVCFVQRISHVWRRAYETPMQCNEIAHSWDDAASTTDDNQNRWWEKQQSLLRQYNVGCSSTT
jgi:hypothetical protein